MAKRPVRVVLTTEQIPAELRRPFVLHVELGPYLKKLRRAGHPETEG